MKKNKKISNNLDHNLKFYQTDEFLKLRDEWYNILEQEGFDDYEWFHRENASPFLSSNKRGTQISNIIKNYSANTEAHFRISRNFLVFGHFYANLAEKYAKTPQIRQKFNSLPIYLASKALQYPLLDEVDYIIWSRYCDGFTLRQTSEHLRALHSSGILGKPRSRRNPYGKSWVGIRLRYLKQQSAYFNILDPDGYYYEPEEPNELDPSLNTRAF